MHLNKRAQKEKDWFWYKLVLERGTEKVFLFLTLDRLEAVKQLQLFCTSVKLTLIMKVGGRTLLFLKTDLGI